MGLQGIEEVAARLVGLDMEKTGPDEGALALGAPMRLRRQSRRSQGRSCLDLQAEERRPAQS